MNPFNNSHPSHYRRRRAPGFRMRYAALPILAIGAIWTFTALFTPDHTENAPSGKVASTLPSHTIETAPLSGITETDMQRIAQDMAAIEPGTGRLKNPDPNSLKAAFDATPVTASYDFKTMAPAAKKIADIQQSIRQILHSDNTDPAPTPSAQTTAHTTHKKVSVGKGDTLMKLLVNNNVPRNQAHAAIQALSKVYDPRGLKQKHEITISFQNNTHATTPAFSGLSIRKNVVSSVYVTRTNDRYTAEQKDKKIHKKLRAFKGDINGSLYLSANAAGMPNTFIIDLIRMYSWSVDFQRDIQPGDAFELMYEEHITEDNEVVRGRGDIIFARLNLSGRDMPYYLYKTTKGDTDYFDNTGRSAKKTLMKTPIDGARLSSGYGMRRHPVLGYSKMHKGMDFAAPRGTPIYAAGDGVIQRIGRNGGYGRYIRIRHNNGLGTAYAHMKGFRSKLKRGNRVKQGQVIGYVGTTGRSTGPHLHYEILMNGRQVNPRRIKLPTGKTLKGTELQKFKDSAAAISRKFTARSTPTALAQNTSSKR